MAYAAERGACVCRGCLAARPLRRSPNSAAGCITTSPLPRGESCVCGGNFEFALLSRDQPEIRLPDHIWRDHDHLPVLELVDRRRVGVGLPVGTELDRGQGSLELAIGRDV